jgi:hypothetical protein
MSKRGWLNLVLLVAVVGLGTLVYFNPGEQAQPVVRLTKLDPDAVQKATLTRPGMETVVLQRGKDGWQLVQPVVVAARQPQVQQLLGLLQLRSLQRYPVPGLALNKYGLEPPRATLEADGVELAFGKLNPLNNHLYVKVGQMMHMVAYNDISLLTGSWTAFVSTAPLPDQTLTRLKVPGLGVIEQGEQGWHYTGDKAPASADQMQALADAWRHAEARQVRLLQEANATEQVVVQLSQGEKISLAMQHNKNELVLQRRDLGLEYVFDAPAAQRLLAWPSLGNS